jgi:glycosyltransferase involved in cell wall biosynthesis
MALSLSIAIASYNGADYLAAQLASLADQTVLPAEVVVCDDRSSDDTMRILEDFAATAPFPVRIFRNDKQLGYARNFARAAQLCKSDLISFCDQDDIWARDKVEILQAHFIATDDLLCSHDYTVFFEDERPDIPSYFEFLRRSGYSIAVNVKGCSLTMRRELIDLTGWPPEGTAFTHDVWVCFGALLLGRKGYIEKPLIRHRIHKTNTSAWMVSGKTDWLRRTMRQLSMPPFTSSADLDVFISFFVQTNTFATYRRLVERCLPHMTAARRNEALRGLHRRKIMCDFLDSSTYVRPLARAGAALRLFLRGVYSNAGGMAGFYQDLRGARSSRS